IVPIQPSAEAVPLPEAMLDPGAARHLDPVDRPLAEVERVDRRDAVTRNDGYELDVRAAGQAA
ncbi:MAG TPA: hypothetical protein VNW24_07755, partial [Stellaceae bacterium]|nr:hypothetical protein [Stellaceae bacterium]